MRLVCPACGAMCSAEAWSNDATCRTTIDLLMRFPSDVRGLVLPYLGLFRTGKSGLTWSRAYRVISDLMTLMESGQVQWEGGELRPAPASLWAAAIEAVLMRRPKGLQNHNYLRHVAWELAGPAAARRERDREDERRTTVRDASDGMGGQECPPSVGGSGATEGGFSNPPLHAGDRPPTDEERAEMQIKMKEFLTKFGR